MSETGTAYKVKKNQNGQGLSDEYVALPNGLNTFLEPYFKSTKKEFHKKEGDIYVSIKDYNSLIKIMTKEVEGLKKDPKYSVMNLDIHDKIRHIGINDAYQLVKEQEDSKNLPLKKLKDAVRKKELYVYEFEGEKYLDRLDIG